MNEPRRRSSDRTDQVRQVLAWSGLVALAYLVYLVVRPFLTVLGWAGVLAIVFYPVHERLARRWGQARAAVASTIAAAIILVVPTLVVAVAFVREALEGVADLQRAFDEGRLAWVEGVWTDLVARLPAARRIDLESLAVSSAQRGVAFLASQTGFVLRDLASSGLTLVLALFTTFFLLRDSNAIVRTIRRLLPLEPAQSEEMLARTRELITAGVTAAGLVAAVQGLLGGLVFAGLGIDAPVFWGVVMAFLCLLPFGAWLVWMPAAVALIVDGSIARGLLLLGLGFGVISGADNVLRPMLLSGHARMNGLVIFLSLLGGISVFGLLGIVLGPVLVVTSLAVVTAYVESLPQSEEPG